MRRPKIDPGLVYLDDCREAPEGWTQVYTASDAIALLNKGNVREISLDHDLGAPENGTGYDVLAWIERMMHTKVDFIVPKIYIHTMNTVANERMAAAVRAIEKYGRVM